MVLQTWFTNVVLTPSLLANAICVGQDATLLSASTRADTWSTALGCSLVLPERSCSIIIPSLWHTWFTIPTFIPILLATAC